MTTKRTIDQLAILSAMVRLEIKGWPPQTGPEISEYLGHPPRWASAKIASLEKRGDIRRLGQSLNCAYCYEIDVPGRADPDALKGAQ